MSKIAPPLTVYLRLPYLQALQRMARELGLKDAEAATRLLEDALYPSLEHPDDALRIRAERDLLELTGELAIEEARAPLWNERLTLAVFERIRLEHLDLYRAATAEGHEDSVNRRIGRRVRDATHARVKEAKGKPRSAKAPAALGALIRRYTLLEPPSAQ